MSVVALAPLGGWLVDLVGGDPRRGHPVAAYGALADRVDLRMWRDHRGAGAAYTAVLVGTPVALTVAAQRRLGPRGRALLLATVTWVAVGGRSLGREAAAVADAVAHGELGAARRRLPSLVGRDPSGLDGAELCRAAIESVAENTADAVVAPLLWAAVLGSTGAAVYRGANTLDAMVGHRSARYERFGWAAARLDDIVTWPAARLGAVLSVALAPAVGGDARHAWRTLVRDGARHPSPNAGRLEAAFAGALGVRLGGTNRYGEVVESRPELGCGERPGPGDVRRAVRLSRAVSIASALVCALAAGALAVRGGRR